MKNIIIFALLALASIQCGSKTVREYSSPSQARGASGVSESPKGLLKAPSDRKMVYTAEVSFQAREKDLEETREKVIEVTREFGGYMLSSVNNTVTVRVNSEKLTNYLEKLKSISDNFNSNIYAQDITDDFYDTEVRLENSRRVRERLLSLLKRSRNVTETVAVEKELARVAEEIELQEGRLKRMQTEISMSKVTIRFHKKYEAPKSTEYKPGILGYPFYYAWQGIKYVSKGITWLFVREEDTKKDE